MVRPVTLTARACSTGTEDPTSASREATGAVGEMGARQEAPPRAPKRRSSKSYIGCDYWPTVTANSVWSIFDFAVVVANTADDRRRRHRHRPERLQHDRDRRARTRSTKIYLPWVPALKGPDADNVRRGRAAHAIDHAPRAARITSSARVPVTVYQFNALEYQGMGGPPGKDWASARAARPVLRATGMRRSVASRSRTTRRSSCPSTAMTGNYRVATEHGWQRRRRTAAYFAITATQERRQSSPSSFRDRHRRRQAAASRRRRREIRSTFDAERGRRRRARGRLPTTHRPVSGSLVYADQARSGHRRDAVRGPARRGIPSALRPPRVERPARRDARQRLRRHRADEPARRRHRSHRPLLRQRRRHDAHLLAVAARPAARRRSTPARSSSARDARLRRHGERRNGGSVSMSCVTDAFEVTGTHEFAVSSFMLGGSAVDPTTRSASAKATRR